MTDKKAEISIIFYEKNDGSMPAKDFILSLDEKLRAKTLRNIRLLAKVGTALREPESSKLDDGIFEIRTKVGTTLTRILYFFCIGKKAVLAVLTNGFVKKTQKTPKREIEKAKTYREDFLKRSKKMSNKFEDFLNEQLKDPKVKKEYDALEAKYTLIESIILARKEKNLTQKELSQLTGITQADLSKIENGNANPSLNTLLKLAKGLGKKLQISLV